MLLCLDVGNTHILGGVYDDKQKLISRFRYATSLIGTADQFGVFLLTILQTHKIAPSAIKATAVCSVVPSCDFTIRHTISLYLPDAQYFILRTGVKTGLKIKYKNPNEVGADRIANAIAAVDLYPQQHLIVVDMGTATTLCAITKDKDYLGGAILPGLRLNMEALKSNTAKLMEVNIEAPESIVGRTTHESIQSGLYFGQLGALQILLQGFKREVFGAESVHVIATGGFAQLYKDKQLFDVILPDLVLHGLWKAYQYNQ